MTNSKTIEQKDYQNYADCIRSDQVPASDIAALMNDKGFSEWYKEKYLNKLQDEQENPYIGDEYCIPDKILVDNPKRKVKYVPGMISCAGVEHIDPNTEEIVFEDTSEEELYK